AKRAGMPLKIAAKIDRVDEAYWREQVAPLVQDPAIEFIGEIDEARKAQFLGEAAALLVPVDWPEPFGLGMIEAMACGTLVIAFRCGSVPEVVQHGVSGFVVDDVAGAVEAVARLHQLPRHAVRHEFERRFTARRMVQNYLAVYRRLLATGEPDM